MRSIKATTIRRVGTAVLSVLLVTAGSAADAAIITVAGSTQGCFGEDCTSFSSPTTIEAYGLTFTGSSITENLDTSGGLEEFDLGTFSRGTTGLSELEFNLLVTFTSPSGIGDSDEQFEALITGNAGGRGAGVLTVTFDAGWQLITFANASGTGSFEFAVINDPQINPNNSAVLMGAIRNGAFTPTSTQPPPTNVPEPATLLLFGLGAAGLAMRRRQ